MRVKCFPFCRRSAWSWCAAAALVQKTQGAAKDEGLDRLLQYLDHLPEHVILLFFCRGKADRTKKVTARIEGPGAGVWTLLRWMQRIRASWLNRQLKAYNKTMSRQAAEKFLSRVDPLLTPTLQQELQKVLSFVGDRMEIEEADVEAVTSPTIDDRLFTMFDDLINGNAQGALTILKNLLTQKNTDTVQLLTPLTNRIRQMYDYKVLKGKGYADREIPEATAASSPTSSGFSKSRRAFFPKRSSRSICCCAYRWITSLSPA